MFAPCKIRDPVHVNGAKIMGPVHVNGAKNQNPNIQYPDLLRGPAYGGGGGGGVLVAASSHISRPRRQSSTETPRHIIGIGYPIAVNTRSSVLLRMQNRTGLGYPIAAKTRSSVLLRMQNRTSCILVISGLLFVSQMSLGRDHRHFSLLFISAIVTRPRSSSSRRACS
jgi:hypothetical protein